MVIDKFLCSFHTFPLFCIHLLMSLDSLFNANFTISLAHSSILHLYLVKKVISHSYSCSAPHCKLLSVYSRETYSNNFFHPILVDMYFFHDMFSIHDKSRAVDILYLDFRKAFDKVPHKRLMAKVRSLGIIDEVSDWIEDWLSDRKQSCHQWDIVWLAGGR